MYTLWSLLSYAIKKRHPETIRKLFNSKSSNTEDDQPSSNTNRRNILNEAALRSAWEELLIYWDWSRRIDDFWQLFKAFSYSSRTDANLSLTFCLALVTLSIKPYVSQYILFRDMVLVIIFLSYSSDQKFPNFSSCPLATPRIIDKPRNALNSSIVSVNAWMLLRFASSRVLSQLDRNVLSPQSLLQYYNCKHIYELFCSSTNTQNISPSYSSY